MEADQPGVPNSMMVAAELRQTEARDGPAGDAVALNNSKYIELPKNVDEARDRPPTICLWARIDKWTNDARIFEYGRKAPQGELFGLRTWDTPGSFAILEQHPKGAYTNVTVNLTDTDRLVRSGRALGRRGTQPTAAIRTAMRTRRARRAPPTAAAIPTATRTLDAIAASRSTATAALRHGIGSGRRRGTTTA